MIIIYYSGIKHVTIFSRRGYIYFRPGGKNKKIYVYVYFFAPRIHKLQIFVIQKPAEHNARGNGLEIVREKSLSLISHNGRKTRSARVVYTAMVYTHTHKSIPRIRRFLVYIFIHNARVVCNRRPRQQWPLLYRDDGRANTAPSSPFRAGGDLLRRVHRVVFPTANNDRLLFARANNNDVGRRRQLTVHACTMCTVYDLRIMHIHIRCIMYVQRKKFTWLIYAR